MEKRIEFTGVDNGLSSMISKLRSESKQLGSDLIADAMKYSNSQKDQLRYLEDQLKALKQKSELERNIALSSTTNPSKIESINKGFQSEQLQTSLLRELIDTIKLTSKEEIADNKDTVLKNIQEFDKRVSRGESIDPTEAFKIGQQKNLLGVDKIDEKTESLFSSLIKSKLLERSGTLLKNFPNAKNELDLITPGFSLAGAGGGALLGTGLEALTGGQIEYAVIAAEMGAQAGEFFGEAMVRNFRLIGEAESAKGSLRGLSGGDIRLSTHSGLGIDNIEATRLAVEVAKSAGTSLSLRRNLGDQLILEKAFNLDRGTVLGQFSSGRITGDNTMATISSFFESLTRRGILSEDDRVLFGEMLKGQQELINSFGQETEKVSAGGVQKLMMNFDKLGGIFSMKDPRQLAAIQAVNSGLRNPINDYAQAINYQVLRKIQNEGGGEVNLWELQKMQAGGLDTPQYLQGIFDIVDGGGGEDWMKKSALKKYFPDLNFDAIERLFTAGQAGELKGIDRKGLIQKGILSDERSKLAIEAGANVSDIDKSTAEITNAFTTRMDKGIITVADKFKEKMIEATGITTDIMIEYVKSKVNDEINKLSNSNSNNKALVNSARTAGYASQMGYGSPLDTR